MSRRYTAAILCFAAILSQAVTPARAVETSCGGSFTYAEECEMDFGGTPIHVEATFTPGEVRSVGIHVEVLIRVGPRLYSPGWSCEQTSIGTASCSADRGDALAVPAPGAREAFALRCAVHRHGNPSDSGSGRYRCWSGPRP